MNFWLRTRTNLSRERLSGVPESFIGTVPLLVPYVTRSLSSEIRVQK